MLSNCKGVFAKKRSRRGILRSGLSDLAWMVKIRPGKPRSGTAAGTVDRAAAGGVNLAGEAEIDPTDHCLARELSQTNQKIDTNIPRHKSKEIACCWSHAASIGRWQEPAARRPRRRGSEDGIESIGAFAGSVRSFARNLRRQKSFNLDESKSAVAVRSQRHGNSIGAAAALGPRLIWGLWCELHAMMQGNGVAADLADAEFHRRVESGSMPTRVRRHR